MGWQQQFGNIASTLSRVSNNATISDHDEVVITCLREAACFIEWSVHDVPAELLLELAAMQRELLAWQRLGRLKRHALFWPYIPVASLTVYYKWLGFMIFGINHRLLQPQIFNMEWRLYVKKANNQKL